MNIKMVVLNDFSICPPDHGGKVRIYNIYRRLSEKFDITYLCYTNAKNIEETKITDNFTVIAIPKGPFHRLVAKHIVRLTGSSVDDIVAMVLCKYDRRFGSIAKKYIGEADVIVSSHPYLYRVIEKFAGKKPVIYESHNVEFSLKRSILGSGSLNGSAADIVRQVEGDLLERALLVFTTSGEDIERFGAAYGIDPGKFRISPNGTDITAYDAIYPGGQLQKQKIIRPPLAIFMGSGHPPNVVAAKIILEELAPRLNDIYFIICGSVCYTIDNAKIGKNAGLAYIVSDEEKVELLRCADVALNPMLGGSGTNLKMLDYMAAGLPVITTPVGARGLGLEPNKHAIICEADQIPAKIRELLSDKTLYDRLSTEGRRLVEDKYTWEKIAREMEETIEKEIFGQ